MKADVLKIAVSALAATLLTGAAAWATFGNDKVTRQELQDYVSHNAPWVVERGAVSADIRANSSNIGKLERICQRLIDSQQQLVVEQRVLVTKVDALLDQ